MAFGFGLIHGSCCILDSRLRSVSMSDDLFSVAGQHVLVTGGSRGIGRVVRSDDAGMERNQCAARTTGPARRHGGHGHLSGLKGFRVHDRSNALCRRRILVRLELANSAGISVLVNRRVTFFAASRRIAGPVPSLRSRPAIVPSSWLRKSHRFAAACPA